MKILYFDTETTGVNPERNDIVQLSGIIEIDGVIKQTFNMRCQPFSYDNIDDKALEVTGNTVEGLKKEQTPQEMYKKFTQLLGRYCNKFDKTDKFYPAGHNVRFDLEFLAKFFVKNGDPYFGSWVNWKAIDSLPLMHMMEYIGLCQLENYKLETVCKHFEIAIDAHDALSDITATYMLIKRLKTALDKGLAEVVI